MPIFTLKTLIVKSAYIATSSTLILLMMKKNNRTSSGNPIDEVLGKKQDNNPHADSDISFKRRQIIWKNVLRNGRLSYTDLKAEVKKKLGIEDLPSQTIQGDLEFWKKLGFPLESVKPPTGDQRERIIVDTTSWQSTAKATRSLVYAEEKQIIAQVCLGAICGFGNWEVSPNEDVLVAPAELDELTFQIPKDLNACYTKSQITAELARPRTPLAEAKATFVSNRLNQFHLELNRLIALDAGTTCTSIAAYISRLVLPTPSTRLAMLSVCTNSRGIFQMLGAPEVNCKTIIIGGEQRGRSEAIAGRLSELFVQSAGILRFGITFLGSTAIDVERMQCCSEDQVLSRLKSILFSQSALRIVCVDHSKLVASPMWSSYPFAAISPEQIDLIVTDLPPIPLNYFKLTEEAKARLKSEWENFDIAVKRIEDHGVPVFLALPTEIKWPRKDRGMDLPPKGKALPEDERKRVSINKSGDVETRPRPQTMPHATTLVNTWKDVFGASSTE